MGVLGYCWGFGLVNIVSCWSVVRFVILFRGGEFGWDF